MAVSGFSEEFFAERFRRPGNLDVLEQQLRDYDLQKTEQTFDKEFVLKNLHFSAKLPEKAVTLLKHLIPSILEFSASLDLRLRDPNHQIRFLPVHEFESESGLQLQGKVPLPASRLDFNEISRVYTVTIILPEEIKTSEQIINITRTLFSKLIGEIYLNESVLPMEFYQQGADSEQSGVSAGMLEKLDILRTQEVSSAGWDQQCQSFAQQGRYSLKKDGEKIRAQLTTHWRQLWEAQALPKQINQVIEQAFEDFLETFRRNPTDVLQKSLLEVKKLDRQIHFLLPHEHRAYSRFEREDPAHYLRAASNKLEEIDGLIGFISELAANLEEGQEDWEPEEMLIQLASRMRQLQQERKALVFLLPNQPISQALQRERQQLPIQLLKQLPRSLPVKEWSGLVKELQGQYENSIYLKLWEALRGLHRWISLNQQHSGKNPLEDEHVQRLRQLLRNFQFRLPSIQQTRSTTGVLINCAEEFLRNDQRQRFPLGEFRKAWSYFISSILITRYYEAHTGQQRFNKERYMDSIRHFVERQVHRGINYYHLVLLFLRIYEEREQDKQVVPYLLYMIHYPQASLRFIFHRLLAPIPSGRHYEEDELPRRLKRVEEYTYTLLKVYENRLQTAILEENDGRPFTEALRKSRLGTE